MKYTNSIDIKQRIPLDILYDALKMHLTEGIDDQRLKELAKLRFQGESGIWRTTNHIKAVLNDENIAPFLQLHKDKLLTAIETTDRNIILLAIINAHFPFQYFIFTTLAAQFRLQDEVNRQLLSRLIGTKYTFNMASEKAMKVVLQHMIEAEVLQRIQLGVYAPTEPVVTKNAITADIWRESFFINNPLWNRENTDDLIFEPYFRYIANA